MNKQKFIQGQRLRRRNHVRRKVRGTPERPRLTVFRSVKHIYAQIVDDISGVTLAAAGTWGKDMQQKLGMKHGGNVKAATEIGKMLGEAAKAKGIEAVTFDRGHYKYHGRVKALADAVREAGVAF